MKKGKNMINIELEKTLGKYVKITDVNSVTVLTKENRVQDKLSISFVDDFGRTFKASDAWIKGRGVKPLYYCHNTINEPEALGQLLKFMNAESTTELIGRRIFVYPDKNNFLLPVCFDETQVNFFRKGNTIAKENTPKWGIITK